MKKIIVLVMTLFLTSALAGEIVRINVGNDYNKYSKKELRKKIWKLERAVRQLQRRVFKLEKEDNEKPVNSWVCTVKAMGDKHTGTGPSKALARKDAMDVCQKARGGDGFFCKTAVCEQ